MRLHEALQHARETGCEFGQPQPGRPDPAIDWLPFDRYDWSNAEVLATDWQCSDGYEPTDLTSQLRAAKERVEVLEGLLTEARSWLPTDAMFELADGDEEDLEAMRDFAARLDTALSALDAGKESKP